MPNTNQYGQTYSGNDDFRGWLAAGNYAPYVMGQGLDPSAFTAQSRQLINHVGNDGSTGSNELRSLAQYNYNYWNGQREAAAARQQAQADADARAAAQAQAAAELAAQQAAAAEAARKQREEEERKERERQRMVGYYNNVIEQKNNAINDLSGSLQNKLDDIEGSYKTYQNEQQSAYNKEKNEYDNSTTQNKQSLVTNRNTITDNASQGLRGLMRVLGAMGAGGGSVARYNAPDAVKAQADQQNANAGLTYSQNQQNLDTDWGNYLNDYENDKKKLEDWKTGQVKSAKQDTEKQRIGLLEELSQAYANRATYDEDPGDNINQITNRIKSANNTIRDLGKYTTPSYNGVTATYKAPELSSYNTGEANLSTTVTDNSSGSPTLLTVLRELNKKKQTNPYTTLEG